MDESTPTSRSEKDCDRAMHKLRAALMEMGEIELRERMARSPDRNVVEWVRALAQLADEYEGRS